MNAIARWTLVSALCLAAAGATVHAAETTVTEQQIDEMLAAVAAYETGMSRAPLIAVDTLVRESRDNPETRRLIESRLAALLATDATLDAKDFACRQLWFLGTAASVPAVAALLADDATVDMACYALGSNPAPEAGAALRAALDTVTARSLIAVVNLLGERRDALAAPWLLARANDPDPALADAVWTALAKLGDDAAAAAIAQARATDDPARREAATDAYLRCAAERVRRGDTAGALPMFRALSDESEPAPIRARALAGLARLDAEDAAGRLPGLLAHSDARIRRAAQKALRATDDPALITRLALALPQEPVPAREEALTALGDMIDFSGARVSRLIEGETLEGWEGAAEWFRVEDGAVVAGRLDRDIPQNEFLCTVREFGDFELRLQVRLLGDPARANAGIQIRSRRVPDSNEVSGYQADMGQAYWGGLYDESRRNRFLASAPGVELSQALKRDDWNEYVIRCVGRRVMLWLNGLKTVDYIETDDVEPRGIIGLQIHGGPPSEAWYQDITLAEF